MSAQLNQSAPAGSIVTLIPDLFPPIDFTVNPTNAQRYDVLVAPPLSGTGADVQCLAPGFLPCRQRVVAADGNTFPQGLPSEGAWELRAFNLQPARPAPPVRALACSQRHHFQGGYVNSNRYGAAYQAAYGGPGQIPYFGAAFADFFIVGDGDQVLDQLQGMGDTHVMHYIGHGGPGYNEPGQPYGADQLIQPANCWLDPDVMIAATDSIINRGLLPAFALDGEGSPEWIEQNFEAFVSRMRAGYDRLAYGPVNVCFDGVWPASWSVADMQRMIPWMRAVLGPTGYLCFWFGNGPARNPYLWVIGELDYQQEWCDGLDMVLTTSGVNEADGVSLANKASYMVANPDYSQFQPSAPSPLGCILVPNSRGERYWGDIEWNTYGTVRDPNQVLKPSIDEARARMQAMKIPCWG